jgi:Fur family peroxide stress response transcriptional regulator
VILESLADRSDHPTADEVYDDVRQSLPDVSRTTVYRVLEFLVDLGIVTKIGHPGAAVRYDPNTQLHHHLICLACNKLIDVEDPDLNTIAPPNTRRFGFKVTDYSIHFRGICRACQREQADLHPDGSKEPAKTRRTRTAARRE